MSTFCFDMDGVICNIDNEFYCDRTPIKKTIELIGFLRDEGDLIIIHTGRHINELVDTKNWLEDNGVYYDHLQFGKPVADVYIDDKALRFNGEWTKETLECLR